MNSFLMVIFFSLIKCILIEPVLQGASTRDFNIFDVDEVFFLFRKQLFSWIVVIIFVAYQLIFFFGLF